MAVLSSLIADNIRRIQESPSSSHGFQVVIISTSLPQQEAFWQSKLEGTRGVLTNPDALILVVTEDWNGGAGNGLGTLYAYRKARKMGIELYGIDILERQRFAGWSAAIYHTAGKGTRLAPLPGSEWNNKPAVKLPAVLSWGDPVTYLTILEAVIKQTAIYASSRPGRLSVFWGDQVFIPEFNAVYFPKHHIDILAKLRPFPSLGEWDIERLYKYGLICLDGYGNAVQIEKVPREIIAEIVGKQTVSVEGGFGVSLGSFSMSWQALEVFLDAFHEELIHKNSSLDSDPHFWMPLTLNKESYLKIMKSKGSSRIDLNSYYERIQKLKRDLMVRYPHFGLFTAIDVGSNCYWWDYGQVKSYYNANLKLLGGDEEAFAMRRFFSLEHPRAAENKEANRHLEIDSCSCVVNSRVKSGRIENCILVGVQAAHIDAKDSILINTVAFKIQCRNSLLYNVIEDHEVVLREMTVRADAILANREHLKLYTHPDRDGRVDWRIKIPPNALSFEELHHLNSQTDLPASQQMAEKYRKKIQQLIFQ